MEEALDPDLPICDPHHHLWDYPESRYMLPELRADIGGGHNVVTTVFVECTSGYRTSGPEELRPVGETEFVVAADPEGLVGGIVGFADLRLPNIDEVLAAHSEAGAGRFRGIRHATAWDASPDIRQTHTKPPPRLLEDPAFGSGIAALGRAGLRFDAWLYHPQLPEFVALARRHSEVPMVLDHLGGPLGIGPYRNRRAEVLEEWRISMQQLVACENVSVKLGGIGMPIYGADWHRRSEGATSEELAAAWREPILWCIERFGVERCMFESNFPVDRASCSYVTLWNTFKRTSEGASDGERNALFHDSAVSFYGL